EYTAHPALDELFAKLFRVLNAGIPPRVGVGAASPEQTVVMHPCQGGQLAANHLEDLGRSEPVDQKPKLPLRDGGRGGGAHVTAGAHAPLDQTLVMEVA